MTVLDRIVPDTWAPPNAAPSRTGEEPAPHTGARVLPWAALAGAIGAAAVSVASSATSGVLAGACVAAFVGVALSWRRDAGAARWSFVGLGLGAVVVGLLAGVGAWAAGDGGPGTRVLSAAVVGWVLVAVLLTPTDQQHSAPQALSPPLDLEGRLVVVAAVCVVAAGGFALLVPAAIGTVGSIVAAVPVALAATLSALRSRGRRWSVTAAATLAACAGAAAGGLAVQQGTLTTTGSTAIVAVAVTTVLAVAALRRSQNGHRATWASIAGCGVAAVALGAGPSALLLVGLATVVCVAIRQRVVVNGAAELEGADGDDAHIAPDRTASALRTRVTVGALTLVGAALRFAAPRGLWLDEATSVHQARLPFGEMLRLLYTQDVHPPLHGMLLWVDIRLVGDSELAVRLPSVLFGALLIPMLYLTGKELFTRRAGLIAAAIATVAPLAVWYGQEARMYAQFMLLATIAMWAQVRILRSGKTRYWVVFTVCCVALIASQYFAALHVGAQFVVFLVEIVRRRRHGVARLARRTAISAAAVIVLILPLVPFALHQVAQNQQSGFGFSSGVAAGSAVVAPPGVYGLLTNVQWILWGYQPDSVASRVVALWPVGLLVLLLLIGRQRRGANRFLLIIGGLPVAAIFAASLFAAKSRSLAEVRYFAGAVPVVFLLLAGVLATAITSRVLRSAMVGAVLASMVVALVVEQTSTRNPRLYQYRGAIDHVSAEARPGDQVVYTPNYLNYVLEYYNPGVPSIPLADGLPSAPGGRVFVVWGRSFAGSADDSAAALNAVKVLTARGMTVESRRDDAQITVWELG